MVKIRFIVHILVLTVLLLALSACGSKAAVSPSGGKAAESTAPPSVNIPSPSEAVSPSASPLSGDTQMYAAYYDAAEKLVSEYGLFHDYNGGGPCGFVHGLLLDLDDDGTDELICFYGKEGELQNRAAVYTYRNGDAVLLMDKISGNGFGSLGINSGLFLSEVGGRHYIILDFGSEYHCQHLYIYRYEDGIMKYRELYADTKIINEYKEEFEYSNCTIDSRPVSVEEYKADYEKYDSNAVYYLIKNPNTESFEDSMFNADDAQAFLDSLRDKAGKQTDPF